METVTLYRRPDVYLEILRRDAARWIRGGIVATRLESQTLELSAQRTEASPR